MYSCLMYNTYSCAVYSSAVLCSLKLHRDGISLHVLCTAVLYHLQHVQLRCVQQHCVMYSMYSCVLYSSAVLCTACTAVLYTAALCNVQHVQLCQYCVMYSTAKTAQLSVQVTYGKHG
jgi:hypothetical protein